MKISKRFIDRARPALRKYQRILESARVRDVGESDTAMIVSDFLTDVLGYDKYKDVTTEFAIRSTFCDLAIKLGGDVRYLIEVKSIGTDLRENHLRQACDYAANQGVEWVLLTNGAQWQAHRMRFEQPIRNDMVFTADLLDSRSKPNELLEKFYLISKEAGSGNAIAQYWRSKEATSRYVIAQVLLSEAGVTPLRNQLRRMFPGVKISPESLVSLLRHEVIKRDALDGEKATAAEKLVRRTLKKRSREKSNTLLSRPTEIQPLRLLNE
jgi:predicted type IV restriction endonuclease